MTTETPISDLPNADAPAGADAAAAPIEAAPAADKPAPKIFRDENREAILARYSAHQREAGDESQQAVRAASEAALPEEERGQALNAPAAAAPAPAADPDVVTVKVYGKELQVLKATVDEAGGVEAYQKTAAADERMRRAAEVEKTLEARDASLREREAALSNPHTAAGAPPSGERPAVASREDAQKLLEAVLESDAETFTKTLNRVIETGVDARIRREPARSASVAPTPAAQAAPVRSVDEIRAANAVFEKEFAAIAGNDATFGLAQDLMKQRMADPQFAHVPLEVLARDVGARVAKAQRTASANNELALRRTVKARIPSGPNAGAPAPAPGNTPTPTHAERVSAYIQQRRARSGSNSTMAERATR